MRWFLSILTLLLVLASGFLAERHLPCRRPLSYSIIEVSPSFGVSADEFRAAVRDAARLWEAALARPLFREAPEGGIMIRALYDHRQEARDTMREIGIRLDEGKRSFDALHARYEEQRRLYDGTVAQFDALRARYDAERAAYETEVAAARAGGADAAALQRLEERRIAVNALVTRLQEAQAGVSAAADRVNAVVAVLQQIARQEDRSLEEFERVGAKIGGEYEAGVFEQRGGERRITLYSFEGTSELTRLLAHELGHALSLPHIADPAAVMYTLNQAGAIELSPADISLLRERCSLHPGAWLWLKDRFRGGAEVIE